MNFLKMNDAAENRISKQTVYAINFDGRKNRDRLHHFRTIKDAAQISIEMGVT